MGKEPISDLPADSPRGETPSGEAPSAQVVVADGPTAAGESQEATSAPGTLNGVETPVAPPAEAETALTAPNIAEPAPEPTLTDEPAYSPQTIEVKSAPAEAVVEQNGEERAVFSVVETAIYSEQPPVDWAGTEGQSQATADQSVTTSPAARAERLRRRRKGWWQRRTNA
jgi:hypothetical protein